MTNKSDNIIEVKHFKISFAEKTVIKDLSFEVKRGEIFGLLGSNGSGKTTTIRTLLGLYKEDKGELLINGKKFEPGDDVRIGYLPEERGLYKKETVFDVMMYFARLRDLKNPKEWIMNYLKRVGLEEFAKTKINKLSQGMQQKIVKDITVTPSDVRRYFKDIPQDSIPFVPTEVEVQIITQQPRVEQEEINRVKEELRDYTDRVNKGESSFQTLARLYSEDPGSARRGGELDYTGRGMLDPAFANVAFGLTDPKKVSKIVESEFGFHIIQLIDKRGEKIKVRHILRKPVMSDEAVNTAMGRLDSLVTAIRTGVAPEILGDHFKGTFTFEDGVALFSDDKDTRNNNGLMANVTQDGRTSRFKMADLPPEVAKAIDGLEVGAVSNPFQMINTRGKSVCAVVKLKNRREGHKATITEDFQIMKNVVTAKLRDKKLHEWVVNRIKSTYVRLNERYRDCKFEYEGWVK